MGDICCPVCHSAKESVQHVVYDYPFTKEVWMRAGLVHLLEAYSSFGIWLRNILLSSHKEVLSRVAVLCWALWRNRNSVVWEGKSSTPCQLLVSHITYLKKWEEA